MNCPRSHFRLFHQTLRQTSTGAGVKLNDIDCTPQENQLVVAESLPGLTLCVLLEASGHSILADRTCIPFTSDQVLLSFSPTASVSENYLPSQQKLRAIDAHFTAEALGKFKMAEIRQVFTRIAAAPASGRRDRTATSISFARRRRSARLPNRFSGAARSRVSSNCLCTARHSNCCH